MTSDVPALDIVGIGNAIVDVLAHVDDGFIARHGLAKSSMTLIDDRRVHTLYDAFPPAIERSGGSAANTLVGAAALGSRGAFIGKVRDDAFGEIFAHDIRAAGVDFGVAPADDVLPTGRCLIAVTPDAERTMNTFLGASVELSPADIDPEVIRSAEVLYLEGYLWDPPSAKEAMRSAIEIARAAGRRVSLSLSDSFCVDRHREEFQELVETSVDILFANEFEAMALYETGDLEETLLVLEDVCELTVVTRSEKGSIILGSEGRIEVSAEPVARPVDATGAGDLYAAGFLHAFTGGADAATCARVGSIAAAEVIGHIGARPEADLAELVEHVVD
jgi:sugar/nucleoside kinase (ribokinase family)